MRFNKLLYVPVVLFFFLFWGCSNEPSDATVIKAVENLMTHYTGGMKEFILKEIKVVGRERTDQVLVVQCVGRIIKNFYLSNGTVTTQDNTNRIYVKFKKFGDEWVLDGKPQIGEEI